MVFGGDFRWSQIRPSERWVWRSGESNRSGRFLIVRARGGPIIIANRSRVPMGSRDWIAEIPRRHQKESLELWVVSDSLRAPM